MTDMVPYRAAVRAIWIAFIVGSLFGGWTMALVWNGLFCA